MEYKINTEFIELTKLLKLLNIAMTGGHAKIMIENGEIIRNGEIETLKRAKIRPGDILQINDLKISII
jgi:ribosome-associated protein